MFFWTIIELFITLFYKNYKIASKSFLKSRSLFTMYRLEKILKWTMQKKVFTWIYIDIFQMHSVRSVLKRFTYINVKSVFTISERKESWWPTLTEYRYKLFIRRSRSKSLPTAQSLAGCLVLYGGMACSIWVPHLGHI